MGGKKTRTVEHIRLVPQSSAEVKRLKDLTFSELYAEHVAGLKGRIGELEIAYCSWEGTPCLVVTDHENKGVRCYEYIGGAWRDPPDNGADVFTKAGMTPGK